MALIFDQIVGHTRTRETLLKVLHDRQRLLSSFLFSGPSGVGKKLMALAWAQGLLCTSKTAPCGECSACFRVSKKSHPDLMILSLTDSATHKIEDIRDLQNFVSLKSFEGGNKVVILDEAQAMTAQASNALLKTLEEPPEGTFFVLLTSNKGAILPTIQSRCQHVMFGALTPTELKKISPASEDWALALSCGRMDNLIKFSDETYKKWRDQSLKIFKNLGQIRRFEGFTLLSSLYEERESALFCIQCWGQTVKASLKQKLGVSGLSLGLDEKEAVQNLCKLFDTETLLRIGDKILKLEQDVLANVNKSLAFEKFFIEVSTHE